MFTDPPLILFLLLSGHALADFALQTEFIATAKDRSTPVGAQFWVYALTGHALLHGGVVALLTGSAALGLAETVIHWATDYAKCARRIGMRTDQTIHALCKVAWWAIWLVWLR